MARRHVTPTNFAFLDIMFCGFGAVVLLVIILNGDVLRKRENTSADLRAELKRVTALEEFARARQEELHREVREAELQQGELQLRADGLSEAIGKAGAQVIDANRRAQTLQMSIASLEAQRSALDNAVALLRSKNVEKWNSDRKPVGFTGDGQRQYLTGLKLGGERTLILIDASASMLDETVVNVIRRKLTDPATRRTAPKWQRTLRTLHWLIANLRPGRKFQVYRFSTNAAPLVAGTDRQWLSTDDAASMSAAIAAARELAPIGGTSLHSAFEAIASMNPRPDSVILLTDGLPTQGGSTAERPKLVTANERLDFFIDAVRSLPGGVPVNTLLFPMEGDPFAAGAFWQLAISSRGAFITPSRDWP